MQKKGIKKEAHMTAEICKSATGKDREQNEQFLNTLILKKIKKKSMNSKWVSEKRACPSRHSAA